MDAHFQSALLYTTTSGQRRVRCSNIVANVSETARDSMRLVDQDAVLGVLAKECAAKAPEKSFKEIRQGLHDRSIDIWPAIENTSPRLILKVNSSSLST